MSIASELNNYRNGLEDAYDAVQDMSGTIPTDRNMVNLDDAIRTIPISSPNDGVLTITQNGATVQTFSANQSANVTAALTDTTYSDMAGATSSAAGAAGLVPAPSAGDQGKVLHGDGTWKDATAKLVEMSYGESNAWAKFIAAYNAGSIVYCRASSNSNPGTGSQTRKAFMAYVNNAASPTNVEFQYVRSQSSKTDSQQCDQVFVYTLTNASGGTWSVATRNMAPKINVSGPITKTFTSGANATVTLGASAMTGATSSAAGAAGIVPKPNSGDQNKVLTGGGSWVDLTGDYSTTEVATPYTWIDGKTIYKRTFKTDNITAAQTVVTHGISNFGALVNAEGVMYTSDQGYQPLNRVLPSLMSTWGWGLGDVQATTFILFFGSGYTLSKITTWITLYYTKSV